MPEVPGQVDPDAMETILDEQEEDLYRWWALVDSGLQGGVFMFIRLYTLHMGNHMFSGTSECVMLCMGGKGEFARSA